MNLFEHLRRLAQHRQQQSSEAQRAQAAALKRELTLTVLWGPRYQPTLWIVYLS